MDKNIFNNLLSNVDTLLTRLNSYKSVKDEYYEKNNSSIPSEITFRDQNGEILASFTLDSNTSHAVLCFLIAKATDDLEVAAETIKNMITEDEA